MKKRMLIAAWLIIVCVPCFLNAAPPPIPNLADWEGFMKDNKNMVAEQPEHADCEKMKEQKQESNLWYYDGIRIFHQIAQYTKDDSWLKVSAKCRDYFRDDYVIGCVKYSTPPWRNFTLGLYYDWTKLHDEISKDTALKMARQGKYAQALHDKDLADWTSKPDAVDHSRKIAYCIEAWHVARDLGAADFAGRDPYLDVAYFQLDTWNIFLTGFPGSTYPGEKTQQYQPFMFALTAEALIRVYERPDTAQGDKDKILRKIKDLAKLTYDKLYSDAEHGFMSNTANPTVFWGSIDLLIVPVYGWLWHVTGEQYFLDAGDKIWKNWAVVSWPKYAGKSGTGKQFSQNYRWSFEYVRWRSVDPVTVAPPPPAAK